MDTTIELNERQMCDVELIMNGGFSPLTGFMNPDTYSHVVEHTRLPDGLVFGLPVVLDVCAKRDDIQSGKTVGLLFKGEPVAVMDIESRYTPDKPLGQHLAHSVRVQARASGHTHTRTRMG